MRQGEITLPSGRCYLFHIQETASSCKTSRAVKLTSLSARSLRTTGTHPVFLGCLVFRVFKQVVSTEVMGSYLVTFADCFFERAKHDMNKTHTPAQDSDCDQGCLQGYKSLRLLSMLVVQPLFYGAQRKQTQEQRWDCHGWAD